LEGLVLELDVVGDFYAEVFVPNGIERLLGRLAAVREASKTDLWRHSRMIMKDTST
jgi:hypothetical protein